MRVSFVLTVMGDDRPGIVEHVSNHVLAAGANWEESRMARLAGKFAGILRVSVDPARAEQLTAGLRELEAKGLKVVVARSDVGDETTERTMGLELVGNDRPGIVRDIAKALASRGVNIEELETEVSSAPMSGGDLFRARAVVKMPTTTTNADLRGALEELANDLMVDLSFDEG